MIDVLKLMKISLEDKDECLPDIDDKCRWLNSVVRRHYELKEELLIRWDCPEYDRQSRRVIGGVRE